MSKKNKRKNNGGSQFFGNNKGNGASQEKQAVIIPSIPKPEITKPTPVTTTVKKVTEEEILADEASFEAVQDCVSKAQAYYETKIQEVDSYVKEKTAEIDELKASQEAKVEEAIKAAREEAEKKVREEQQRIIDDATAQAESKRKELEEREATLHANEQALISEKAQLEKDKIDYKTEVYNEISKSLETIKNENATLIEEKSKVDKEIIALSNQLEVLKEESEIYSASFRKSKELSKENLRLKAQIEEIQGKIQTIEEISNRREKTIEQLNQQILIYGDDPSRVMNENLELQKKVKELQDTIAGWKITPETLTELQKKATTLEEKLNEIEQLRKENLRLKTENLDVRVSEDELESYRKFIKILQLQKDELQQELDRNISLYSSKNVKVFPTLSSIDSQEFGMYPSIIGKVTLKDICTQFRAYLQNRTDKVPLYYTEAQIRTFIAGFAASRLMILEGLSGTGKSSLPTAFMDFMGSVTTKVPVQSSWKDRNDLLGFYNDFKKQYKETEFLKALYQATRDKNNIHVIVLDEMNLSRIEYYFADLLSVLEDQDSSNWRIELISDYSSISANDPAAWPKSIQDGKLQILDNTWFVGTANKDDSTFTITDKVYDRAVVLNFENKGQKTEELPNTGSMHLSSDDFNRLLSAAKRFKTIADKDKYQEMIEFLDKQVIENFKITFGNRIANQLEVFVPVYIACGGTLEEAVDIMFSRKVLRKLEGLYDDNTKTCLEVLRDSIKEKYGVKLPITLETLNRMMNRI